MHTVKALMLTVSLLGITMVGALAHGGPERTQAPCAPVVTPQQRGERGQYDGRRNDSRWYAVRGTVRDADRRPAQAQPRRHADGCQCARQQAAAPRWQHASPAERHARRQQWHQRWQNASPAERQAMKARWHHQR